MFYQNLKNIKGVNTLLNEQQIFELNNYLSSLLPGSTIAIDATAYNTGISRKVTEEILILLSDFKLINTLFVIRCDNENFDFVHTYTFSTFEELVEFVKHNKSTCLECDSELLEDNTEVFFVIPQNNIKKVL